MKKAFVILFSILSILAYSQMGSIKGRIQDEKGGLEFVSIGLTGTNYSTNSDSKGYYELSAIPLGAYELQVTMVGYMKIKQKVTISPSKPLIIDHQLIPTDNRLNEVVVTGTLNEVSKSESAIPIDILTPKLFQKNPSPSLFESIGMVNGIQPQLNCNVCNTGDIHINGMEGPYTMITIDGMPIVSSLATVYGLSGIPNSLVNRIEVVKGPASTLFGSEAVGGLINVITKNPISAPKISADVMATSDQEFNVDLGFKNNIKKAHSLLGVNYFNFQNRMDKNNDGFTDVTLQHRISLFNKWSFERKENRVATIAARFVYEDRWGGETDWNKEFRGGDSIYGESIYTTRYELIGNYQLPVAGEHIFFQYSFNTHLQDSYYGLTSYNADQTVAFAQLYWNKKINDKIVILSGIPLRYTYYDDNTPATQMSDTLVHTNKPSSVLLPGIFIQPEIKFNTKTTLLSGLRYDHNSTHGHILSPRLAFKYAANENNILRLSSGNGYRVVNLFTEDHAALTGAREVIVKKDLKPERSWNVNLNYQKYFIFKKGIVNLDASLFYTYFTNRIIADFTSNANQIIYDNLNGYAVSQGGSLSLDLTMESGLKIILAGTFMDVYSMQNDSLGHSYRVEQMHAPQFSGNFTASYAFSKSGISIDYTGIVKGPMLLPTVPNDFRPQYSPWFSLQNIQLTKKFKKGIEIYGGVKNILNFVPKDPILRPFDPFDKHITENNPNGYSFDPSYNYAPIQGRRYFIGIRYTLN